MDEEKENEIIGYYTDDGNIYSVECINKDSEMMKSIEQAITEEDLEEACIFVKDERRRSTDKTKALCQDHI